MSAYSFIGSSVIACLLIIVNMFLCFVCVCVWGTDLKFLIIEGTRRIVALALELLSKTPDVGSWLVVSNILCCYIPNVETPI